MQVIHLEEHDLELLTLMWEKEAIIKIPVSEDRRGNPTRAKFIYDLDCLWSSSTEEVLELYRRLFEALRFYEDVDVIAVLKYYHSLGPILISRNLADEFADYEGSLLIFKSELFRDVVYYPRSINLRETVGGRNVAVIADSFDGEDTNQSPVQQTINTLEGTGAKVVGLCTLVAHIETGGYFPKYDGISDSLNLFTIYRTPNPRSFL